MMLGKCLVVHSHLIRRVLFELGVLEIKIKRGDVNKMEGVNDIFESINITPL